MVTSVTARVDFENNAETFWHDFKLAVAQMDPKTELYRNCRQIMQRDEVELLDAQAIEQFDEFVTGLEGWTVGDDHAANPIVFNAN